MASPMKILIAPDSFKGSLRAIDVALCIKAGMQKVMPHGEFQLVPMADGGEGTVEAVLAAVKGSIIETTVHDPLMRQVPSFVGMIAEKHAAIIEMAAASGLMLLSGEERNPWLTTSFGTGELIKVALDNHCPSIILGIGGSATNDAGVGMAMALGARFLDKDGRCIFFGGGELGKIRDIDLSAMDTRLRSITISVACDVTNPLTGENGASAVFAPQKGADAAMVKRLDDNLASFSRVIKDKLGKDVEKIPGAGAAGGMGAGVMAFLDAKLSKGFDIIARMTELEQKISAADLVITGEGKVDAQTAMGKTAFGVAQLAKKYNKPVILIAGSIDPSAEILYSKGIDAMLSIVDKPMSLAEALANAPELLRGAGERVARMVMSGDAKV